MGRSGDPCLSASESMLYSRSVSGTACRFRTAYPVHLWPLEVRQARFELPVPGVGPEEGVRMVLRLELKTFGGVPLRELREKISESEEKPLESLRFYLQGEGKVVYALHELLHNHLVAVELRPGGPRDVPSPVRLPKSDGKIDMWSQSAAQGVVLAKTRWVRLSSNMGLGAYDVLEATAPFPEPEWPDVLPQQIFEIAFRDRVISTIEHPVVRRLRGLE